MNKVIGIRKEEKNKWERRAPLIPEHVGELSASHSVNSVVEPSSLRAFSEDEYIDKGAKVEKGLRSAPVIFGIKEIPQEYFQEGKTYLFFSHTIKGQSHNMPMLKCMMEKKCQLIDYEKVTDDSGRRLLFFGTYAGHAGFVDSLWALGQRFKWEGISTPFNGLKKAHKYSSLNEAKTKIKRIGQELGSEGIPASIRPVVFGIAGYGHVSTGAQEMMDLLPTIEVEASDLGKLTPDSEGAEDHIYKVVFKEKDMVEPKTRGHRFELQDYYDHPEKYKSKFGNYLPYLTLLINAIYWEDQYPRLVTKERVKKLYSNPRLPHLKVIGDISCDIGGAVEVTTHSTDPGQPVFVYDVDQEKAIDGY